MFKLAKILLISSLVAYCCCCSSNADGETTDSTELAQALEGGAVQEPSGKPSLLKGFLIKQAYKKINKYLSENVEDDSDKANIDKAIEWMNSLNPGSKKTGALFGDQLLEGLKQFTALRELDGDNICNAHSYDILLQNDYATGGVAHAKRNVFMMSLWLNRANKIVHNYIRKHALKCQNVYPAEFKKTLAQLDNKQVEMVDSFFGTIRADRFRLDNNSKSDEKRTEAIRESTLDNYIVRVSAIFSARTAYDIIEENADNDLDLMYLRSGSKDKLKGLVDKYIVQPCRYYVKQLGFGLLEPASYDKEVLELAEFYAQPNDDVIKFLIGLDNYRLCSNLNSKGSQVGELLDNLVVISKRVSPDHSNFNYV